MEDDGTKRSRLLAEKRANDMFGADLEVLIRKCPTFHLAAQDFWDWNKSRYVRARVLRDPKALTQEHVANMHGNIIRWALPHLGKYSLDQLTPGLLDSWADGLLVNLSSQTVKHCVNAVSGVLEQAWRDGLISSNPVKRMLSLVPRNKTHGTLTPEEITKLLKPEDFTKVWGIKAKGHPSHDPRRYHVMSLLSAALGTRWNEIAPIRVEDFETFVFNGKTYWMLRIEKSIGRIEGVKVGTKTGKGRVVPLAQEIMNHVLPIMPESGFLFPGRNPKKPISHHSTCIAFIKALKNIGIDEAKRQERNLGFHSWRHCFTTNARGSNISDAVVMAITEHTTDKMRDLYTHFEPGHLISILPMQIKLLEDNSISKKPLVNEETISNRKGGNRAKHLKA